MKRVLYLCLAFMFAASALAEPVTVRYSGNEESGQYALLMDEDGTPLTPRDTYGSIFSITQNGDDDSPTLYAATAATLEYAGKESYENPYRFALMDETGQLLTGFDCLSLDHFAGDNVVIFSDMNSRHGAMNEQGEVILEPNYINLCPNGRGGYLGMEWPEDGTCDYGTAYPVKYIDEKGRSFDTGFEITPYSLSRFREGLCVIYADDASGNRVSVFLDFEGTDVFKKTYGWTDGFYGNFAAVRDKDTGLYGLIDKTGAWALSPEYGSLDSGMYYDSNTFYACGEGQALLLDAYTLETLASFDFTGTNIHSAWLAGRDFISANAENEFYLYDFQGNLLIQSASPINIWYSFTDAMPQRLVRTDGSWPNYSARLVDLSGKDIGPAFQDLSPVVWRNGQGRYIFSTCDMIATPEGDAYPDWTSYRYGLCDQDGNILLDAKYSSLEYLSPDRYWARQGTRSGMIDETGAWYYIIDDFEYLMD